MTHTHNVEKHKLSVKTPKVEEEPEISEEFKKELEKIREEIKEGKYVHIGSIKDFAKRYGL